MSHTVVLVPGLRSPVEDHWQTRLAARLPRTRTVPPLGRSEASLRARVTLLDRIVADVESPVVLVAHGAGALVTAHWADRSRGTAVVGALLVTPTPLATELPDGFPSIRRLREHGWLPVPRRPLPFPSVVAASTDDPLGNPVRLRALARAWGSRWHELGPVGHLEQGDWPGAETLIAELADGAAPVTVAEPPLRWLQLASA